jgi:hypothetical protein
MPKVTKDHILSSLREEIIFDIDFISIVYFLAVQESLQRKNIGDPKILAM